MISIKKIYREKNFFKKYSYNIINYEHNYLFFNRK